MIQNPNNAIIKTIIDGNEYWFKNVDGNILYYKNGKLHRENGPAVEYVDGSKEWWVNDELHREDGPAVEYAYGSKEWWVDGKRHRVDGPAVESVCGDNEWWVDDTEIKLNEFISKISNPEHNIFENWEINYMKYHGLI